ncbi:MAG: thrombospondin type 3 repeat-containing protein [Pseudomonadota bacterium]
MDYRTPVRALLITAAAAILPLAQAELTLTPDMTDLPPPIVLQQQGVTADEYRAAIEANAYTVVQEKPDRPIKTGGISDSAEAIELTAAEHRAIMDAASAAGAAGILTPGQIKAHIQGEYLDGPTSELGKDGGRRAQQSREWPDATPETSRATGDRVRNFQTLNNTGFIPPDTQIAVGPSHVIVAVNSAYTIYNLDGVIQGAAQTPYNALFTNAIPDGFTGNLFDPKIVYSPWHGRYVMLILGVDFTNQTSFYFIAFSQTSDPTQGWWLYRSVNNGFLTSAWLDYSGLGVDDFGVYASGNMFNFSNNAYQYSMVRYFDEDGFNGDSLNSRTFTDVRWPDDSRAFTIQPAVAHTRNLTNDGTSFFVATRSGSGDEALLMKLTGHVGPDAPAGTLSSVVIDVGQYDALGEAVAQPGTTARIDGGDARVLNAVYSQGNLYATLTNDLNNDGTRGAVYTFRLGTSANNLEWSQNLQSPGWYYTYPAVTVLGAGGDTTPVGVYMSITRGASDTSNGLFASAGYKLYEQPEVDGAGAFSTYRNGAASYVNRDGNNRNRWGDYTGAAYDWNCPGRMWGAAEYVRSANQWGTQAAAVMMDDSAVDCATQTPAQVQSFAPNGNITDTTPTYTWARPSNQPVGEFVLTVSQSSGAFVFDETITPAQAGCDDDFSCAFTPSQSLALGDYTFSVRARNSAGIGAGSTARAFSIVPLPPFNDNFGSAVTIFESANGTLVGATQDGSTSGTAASQKDVWYRFVTPGPGTLRVNSCGSQNLDGLDTVLSLHANDGSVGTGANQIALNDDWEGTGGDATANCPRIRDSAVAVDVTQSETVYIRVSRFSTSTDGRFILNASFEEAPPVNDAFDSPILISASVPIEFSFYGATRDGSSSADSTSFVSPDVWFVYDVPSAGELQVNTCGSLDLSNIDTILSLHDDNGAPGSPANELAANDNWDDGGDPDAACPGSFDSATRITLNGAQRVLIRVARGDDIGGPEFLISINFTPSTPPVDTDGDGVFDAADNCTLLPNADQRDTNADGYGNVCDADINNDGVVNFVDLGQLRTVFFTNTPDADFNGDGVVNFLDLGVMRTRFFQPPGPSGVAP